MVIRSRLGSTLLLTLWLGCLPGPFDEVGTRCSVERPCSAPLFCVVGVCSLTPALDGGVDAGRDAGADGGADAGFDAGLDAGLDAGTDGGDDGGAELDAGDDAGTPFPPGVNLLRNPSFELALADGGTPFWSASAGTVTSLRQGALHGNYVARLTKTGNPNPGLTSATVPGTTAFAMLFCAQASVRHDEDTFTINLIVRERFPDGGINASNGGGGRVDGGAWATVSESLVTFGNGNAMDVRLTAALPPDGSVFVDDVRLVRAAGTSCP